VFEPAPETLAGRVRSWSRMTSRPGGGTVTLYRRNARISMGCAAVFAGAALCLANSPYWPGTLLISYLAFGAVWYGQDQRRRHHRRMIEEEWWRRTRLGVRQPPLDPCYMPFDETSLHHDERSEERRVGKGCRVWW